MLPRPLLLLAHLEEARRRHPAGLGAGRDRVRGEVTVVLGAMDEAVPDLEAAAAAAQRLIATGVAPSEAVRRVAAETGVARRALYERVVTAP